MSISPFFFVRTNSKTKSTHPPYSKRALIAIIVAIPVAFGLNIPLNSMVSFMPFEAIIMINAIVIPSYMTFVMPKISKIFFSWMNS